MELFGEKLTVQMVGKLVAEVVWEQLEELELMLAAQSKAVMQVLVV